MAFRNFLIFTSDNPVCFCLFCLYIFLICLIFNTFCLNLIQIFLDFSLISSPLCHILITDRGSKASLKASPTKFTAVTTKMITSPGGIHSQGCFVRTYGLGAVEHISQAGRRRLNTHSQKAQSRLIQHGKGITEVA